MMKTKTKAQKQGVKVFPWEKSGDDFVRIRVSAACLDWWVAKSSADAMDPELDSNGEASFCGIESTEWAIDTVGDGPSGIQILSVCYRGWKAV
jgi:hypothetical protein